GIACVVANAGTVGVGRLTLSRSVDVTDGRLDVFFLKKANLEAIEQIVSRLTGLDQIATKLPGLDWLRRDGETDLDESKAVSQRTVETVEIRTNPVLDIQVDGDVVAKTPQLIRMHPAALRV